MSKCKWDRAAEDYLRDGRPCRWDDYGDPTKHCESKRGCSNHIAQDELTCARCLGRTRNDIRRIVDLSALMLPVAISSGVNSEAAYLAAPAARVTTWNERRDAMRRHITTWTALERITERQATHALAAMPDDDPFHPYSVLTRWEFMLREDYRTPRDDATSIASAADYLGRVLHRVAQDEEQEFALLARDMRSCREHLESVIHNSATPERGAPCPICAETGGEAPKLAREYGHWCDADDCERMHYADDSDDWWICPRNKAHRWSHEDYRRWVDDWADDARGA